MSEPAQLSLLLVDDDEADANALEESLSRESPHCSVRWVQDGEKALAYLRKEGEHFGAPDPDLILLDWGLPRLSGLDVLKIVKHDPELRGIPVIVYSGSRSPDDVRAAYANQASAFIQKPLALDRLVETHRLLRDFWLEVATLPRRG